MLSIIPLLLASLLLTRMLRPRHRVDFLLIWATVLPACIFFLAVLASGMDCLASTIWWTVAAFLLLGFVSLPLAFNHQLRQECLRRPAGPHDLLERIKRARTRYGDLALLWTLGLTVVVAGVINLVLVVFLAPANLDGLSYHLARMAYYLQHGNFNFFENTNYWAIVVHPKVSTSLILYTYLAGGRNENLTQLVQYLSYWVGLLSVYGIARHLGAARRGSLFAALIFGLFTICLMEASTVQNDLVLTAFTGGTLYFLLAYRESRQVKYLWLTALAFALALGVKVSMLLVVPSLLAVAVLLFLRSKKAPPLERPHIAKQKTRKARAPQRLRSEKTSSISLPHIGQASAAIVLLLCLVTLPAGYWDNWRQFKHLTGPPVVSEQHTFAGKSLSYLLGFGAVNMLRYGIDFLRLDGIPPTDAVCRVQDALYFLPRKITEALGIDLASSRGTRVNFTYEYNTMGNENRDSWGLLGFLLAWPVVWLVLFREKYPLPVRLFALTAVVFFLAQAFSGPFDIWRGRFFVTAGLFAAPPLAFIFLPAGRGWRVYLSLVVVLGCLSALLASVYREHSPLLPMTLQGQHFDSVFSLPPYSPAPAGMTDREFARIKTRIKQLMRELPTDEIYQGLVAYEADIPKDATIALDTGQYGMEYLLFGRKLTRTLYPLYTLNGTWVSRIPKEAQFLVATGDSPFYNKDDKRFEPIYQFSSAYFSRDLYIRSLP